jgi:hypothetical protein
MSRFVRMNKMRVLKVPGTIYGSAPAEQAGVFVCLYLIVTPCCAEYVEHLCVDARSFTRCLP